MEVRERIKIKDLIGHAEYDYLEQKVKTNIDELHWKVNVFLDRFHLWLYKRDSVMREQYDRVTSGLRSKEHHKAIYDAINARRAKKGLAPLSIPWGSKHLMGCACDLYDAFDLLKEFAQSEEGQKTAEELDLYFEHPSVTDDWLHLQTEPFASYTPGGTRFFYP